LVDVVIFVLGGGEAFLIWNVGILKQGHEGGYWKLLSYGGQRKTDKKEGMDGKGGV